MPRIPTPSWLLLIWCGLIASIASEWLFAILAAFIGRRSTRSRTSVPQLMNAPRASVPLALLAGTLVAAPAYGIAFEWLHRADLAAGVTIGALHGIAAGVFVLFASFRRRDEQRGTSLRPTAMYRLRRFATRIAYGALMGLLYVVPR